MDFQRLDNGVELVLRRMPGFHSVSVGAWVRTGSRCEGSGERGAAHFLEHLLFKGTTGRSGETLKRLIEGVGGVFNAFTGEEVTCYHARMPRREDLPVACDVLADMIARPRLPAGEIDRERQVIVEEIRMCRDIPQLFVEEMFSALLFPRHPLGRPITGTPRSLGALDRAALRDYWRRSYTGPALVVSVAGDLDETAAAAQVRDRFACLPDHPRPPRPPVGPPRPRPACACLERETEQVHFLLGARGVAAADPRRWALALLAVILGGNMSSRLYLQLRERRGLVYHVSASDEVLSDTGAFAVSAGAAPGRFREALAVARDEIARLAAEPVGAGELSRARDFLTGQLRLQLESTTEYMNFCGEQLAAGQPLESAEQVIARIGAVGPGEITAAARLVGAPDRLRLAAIGPPGTRRAVAGAFPAA